MDVKKELLPTTYSLRALCLSILCSLEVFECGCESEENAFLCQ